MAEGLQLFTTFLLVQLFYALAVTLIVPTLPDASLNQVVMFTNSNNVIQISTLKSSLETGVTGQSNIPLLEFGAMIFYTSNIIINLMLNFFTAIPQMITALVSAFLYFVPIVPIKMQQSLIMLVQAILSIIYSIAILTFIMGARSPMKGVG
jgi:hypothetical protein